MLKQSLQQKLLQKMSPQQIQLMKLLQVPTVELEQRIKEELEENPALEEGREDDEDILTEPQEEEFESDGEESAEAEKEFDFSDYMDDDDTPEYKLSVQNHGPDDDEYETPIGAGTTFAEDLLNQLRLRNVTERQMQLSETVIGNLDESGYLQRDIRSMVNDLAFTQNIMATTQELEEVLAIVQDLDPPGVGARDLRECLLLQIRRVENRDYIIELAEKILLSCFDEFTKKHYDKIIKKLDLEEEDLKEAISEIVRLNPKPGGSSKENIAKTQQIVPDFLMSVEDDKITIALNQRNAPDLRISPQYKEMIDTYMKSAPDKKQKEAIQFVKQKLDAAKWFIDAIKQRQNTLLLVMNAITDYQREFFLTGDPTKMKPMILKDIADIVKMDISTISRVANSKYLQTPYGTTLLKPFFSESLSTDSGEEVSTIEVKNILREAIAGEDKRKPLADDKLMAILNSKGYNIARRTVAKYREQLDIPVARLRKEL